MTEQALAHKLAAILYADVEGYSRLTGADEAGTHRTLSAYLDLFSETVKAHHGEVKHYAGDAVLADFSTVSDALNCAVAVQRELKQRNDALPEDKRVQFRIGLNLGEVIVDRGEVYGNGVNVAARLETLAEPGGICVSGTVVDAIGTKLSLSYDFLGEQPVKNIEKPVRAYRVRSDSGSATPRPKMRFFAAHLRSRMVGLGVAVMVAGAVLWYQKTTFPTSPSSARTGAPMAGPAVSPTRKAQRARLAVLPLANISRNPEDEYFSDGMTEELISRLSRLQNLDVIARTSVTQYKGKSKSVSEIGRELGVSNVLEGSVRMAGDKVRITVQLIDVATQGHLWTQDYDRELKDVLATQADISERVATALHVEMSTADGEPSKSIAGDTEAYQLFLKGRYHSNRATFEGLSKSIEYFEQALARSPSDARYYAGLAEAHAMLGFFSFLPPAESFPKAKAAAEKALALDRDLAPAHVSLGLVRFFFDRDWVGAEQSFRRAVELSPSYATAHLVSGIYFKAMGNKQRAEMHITRANELDPLFLMANAEIGWVAYYFRDYPTAVRSCRNTLELDPNLLFALQCLQFALVAQRDPEAVTISQKIVSLTPGDTYQLAFLGWAQGRIGNRTEAEKILKTIAQAQPPALPAALAFLHIGLGNKDQAFEWIEKMYEMRAPDLIWVKTGPEYDPLRSDARFTALLKRMNLE
jgi:adenylate cyclase